MFSSKCGQEHLPETVDRGSPLLLNHRSGTESFDSPTVAGSVIANREHTCPSKHSPDARKLRADWSFPTTPWSSQTSQKTRWQMSSQFEIEYMTVRELPASVRGNQPFSTEIPDILNLGTRHAAAAFRAWDSSTSRRSPSISCARRGCSLVVVHYFAPWK